MVKGISRQVIVVQSPDTKLFEQAIFILKDDAIGENGITDELLLKEAKRVISGPNYKKRSKAIIARWICIASGAIATGIVWLITSLL